MRITEGKENSNNVEPNEFSSEEDRGGTSGEGGCD